MNPGGPITLKAAARILVVGGAGYIGSHVVHDLAEAGHRVVLLDNLSTGDRRNRPPEVSLVVGDLVEGDELDAVLADGIDVVFHFAARKAVGESMEYPHRYSRNNLIGTLRLLAAMRQHGVSRFVFSSSAAVYGSPRYLPIDEAHACHPDNYYGYTKLAIEENLDWFDRLTGLRYASLRYFNATGYDLRHRVTTREKETANLTPIVMEAVIGMRDRVNVFGGDYETRDGTCIRDYIHVNDLADAHLAAMDALLSGSDSMVLNLGTETGSTVLEMLEAATRVFGVEIARDIVERRAGDPAVLVASSARARELLGWQPRRSDLDTVFDSMRVAYGL